MEDEIDVARIGIECCDHMDDVLEAVVQHQDASADFDNVDVAAQDEPHLVEKGA